MHVGQKARENQWTEWRARWSGNGFRNASHSGLHYYINSLLVANSYSYAKLSGVDLGFSEEEG